ncbi:MAG: hypothetical protein IPL46_32145 [Saprospiraceae bacterium]|nr:hypothetical protein [Saprospiraceae bacterium]
MKHLLVFIFSVLVYSAYPQACKMPSALDQIRPEKCGIRYVKSEGDRVNVILEFEKKTRILTPDNPNDVRGKLVNLIGIYYLTYDQDGEILDERRVFVQTGEIPDKGLVFGLNGQRGEMLEKELNLISLEEYANVPWGGKVTNKETQASNVMAPQSHFESTLNVDKNLKLTELEVVKWQRSKNQQDSVRAMSKIAPLIEFDSATKKKYWINQYIPVTDPSEGFTMALLNNVNKDLDKGISDKALRLVSFDSNGLVAGSHEFDFPVPMQIVYRNEIYKQSETGAKSLEKEIWVLKSKEVSSDAFKLGQYYYYWFNKRAQLQSSAVVVSKHNVFNPLNVFWHGSGVFYMSNTDHEIVSCYINDSGKYSINSTNSQINSLKDFIQMRSQNSTHNIRLALLKEPTIFEDQTVLMIYRVQENVGMASVAQMSPEMAAATLVDHGFVAIHLKPEGQIIAADFYQRPADADPRAFIEMGPVQRNENGNISFYASDITSGGMYPVLCTISKSNVTFVKSEQGPIAAKLIYYDPNEEVVGYFGIKKNPDDPRNSIRTLEILRVAQ